MKRNRIIKAKIEDVNRAIQLAYPGKPYLPVVKYVTVLNDIQYFDVEDFLLYPNTVLPDDIYDYIARVYKTQVKMKAPHKDREQQHLN